MITNLLSLLVAGVTVTLPMESKVRGTEIRIGEIARVDGADPSEVRAVQAIELGYAPSPGYSRLFSADKLRETLERKAAGIAITLCGERACRVWPEVLEIPSSDIAGAARAELERAFGSAEASFELTETLPRVVVPAGSRAHRLRAKVQAELASGVIGVPVVIVIDDATYSTVWTSWKVEVFNVQPVLARAVKAGEALRSTDFERRRVRVDAGPRVPQLDAVSLVGSVASHDLREGAVVTQLDVNRPTVV